MGTCLIMTEPLHLIYHPSLFHLKFTSSNGCKTQTVENKPKEKNCPCLNLSASVSISNGWALHMRSSHHYSHQKGDCLPPLPAISPSFMRGSTPASSFAYSALAEGQPEGVPVQCAQPHIEAEPGGCVCADRHQPTGVMIFKGWVSLLSGHFFWKMSPISSVILLQFLLTWELHRDDM